MADIVILISGIDLGSNNNVRIDAIAFASPDSGTIQCSTEVAFNALASTMNTAIKDAAITAAGVAGYTVGALDKKTLLGGAVGL